MENSPLPILLWTCFVICKMKVLYQMLPKIQPSKGAATKILEVCSENGTVQIPGITLHNQLRSEILIHQSAVLSAHPLLIRNHPSKKWTTLWRCLESGRWNTVYISLFIQMWSGFAPEVREHGLNTCVIPQADLRPSQSETESETVSQLFEIGIWRLMVFFFFFN